MAERDEAAPMIPPPACAEAKESPFLDCTQYYFSVPPKLCGGTRCAWLEIVHRLEDAYAWGWNVPVVVHNDKGVRYVIPYRQLRRQVQTEDTDVMERLMDAMGPLEPRVTIRSAVRRAAVRRPSAGGAQERAWIREARAHLYEQ